MTISVIDIDDTKPTAVLATTASVRDNFTEVKEQFGEAATHVATVTELKGINARNGTVFARGENTAGDGGGGEYYWDSTSTDPDDGKDTVLPTGWTDPGRWKRVSRNPITKDNKEDVAGLSLSQYHDGTKIFITSDDGGEFTVRYNATPGTYADDGGSACGTQFIPTGGDGTIGIVRDRNNDARVNVKWFGAKIDGVTDDYAAINTACGAFSGVFIPEGTTVIGTALSLNADQDLVGAGWRQTIIKLSGVATRINIEDFVTMRDLKVRGDDTQTFGISVTATASRWLIERVNVGNVISGIGLNNCWIGSINDCLIRDCTNGIFLHDGLSSNGPVNAINIIGGEIAACTYGIRFAQNGGSTFNVNAFNCYGVTIEPGGTYGVWLEDVGAQSLKFDGCYFELCGEAAYQQDAGCNSVSFVGGLIDLDTASTDKGIVVSTGITDNFSIEKVEFDRRSGSTATDAVSFAAAAEIRAAYMQGNVKGNSALVVDNNMTAAGSAITYIADDFFALGSALPKIFSLGGGSRPNSAGKNFMNSAVITNPATTVAVTFGTAEADSDYEVTVFDFEENLGNYWITSKATTGFTINVATTPATSATVHWMLTRR